MLLLWAVLCATFIQTWQAWQLWDGVRSWLPLRSSPTAATSGNR